MVGVTALRGGLAVAFDGVIGLHETRHVLFIVEIAGGATDAGIDKAAHADMITDLESGDLGANGADDTGDFVARNDRVDGVLPFVADGMNVGMADTGIFDIDDDVVIIRLAAFEGERGKRLRRICRSVTSCNSHLNILSGVGDGGICNGRTNGR